MPRPTLTHVWLAATGLTAGVATGLMPVESIDYWWTIKLGEQIWRTGALPTSDPLVYTPVREPVFHGQWLAQVLLYGAHAVGGPELALAVRTIVALAVAAFLAQACVRGGAGVRPTAVLVSLALIAMVVPGLAIRPQLLAVIPFLLVTRAAFAPPAGWPGALGLAGMVAFWANVHGSFVLAYLLLGAGLADAAWCRFRGEPGDRPRRAIWLTILCVIAPLANPHGLGLGRYVLDAVAVNADGAAAGVIATEWMPPTLKSPAGAAFYGSIVLVTVLLALGRRPRPGEGLLLLGLGLLTILAARNVLWWGLALTPYLARALTRVPGDATDYGCHPASTPYPAAGRPSDLSFRAAHEPGGSLSGMKTVMLEGVPSRSYRHSQLSFRAQRGISGLTVRRFLTAFGMTRGALSVTGRGGRRDREGARKDRRGPWSATSALGTTGGSSDARALPAGSPLANAACLLLMGLLVALYLPWWRDAAPGPPSRTAVLDPDTPVRVAEYLAAHQPPGALFNDADWGAYLAWRLAPTRKVFVDDRYELHPPEVWHDYLAVGSGHVSWERILKRYGVTQVVVDPRRQRGLLEAMRNAPDWAPVYDDGQALVFELTPR